MRKLLLLLLCVPLIGFGQTKQELKEQLNKKLSEVSNEINKSCPMVLDECTTINTTYGGMGMIKYMVTFDPNCLTRLEMSSLNEWEIYQTLSLKNNFCTDPSFQTFRDFGVKMIWRYQDPYGKFITKIELTDEDCQ